MPEIIEPIDLARQVPRTTVISAIGRWLVRRAARRPRRNGGLTETVDQVKITVEINELKPGITNSHAVADYVRALFKLRALKRAAADASIEAEQCKRTLNNAQLIEAVGLLYDVGPVRRQLQQVTPPNGQGLSRNGE
jgi:hypothetical protein